MDEDSGSGAEVDSAVIRGSQEEKNGNAESVGLGFGGDEKLRCGAGRP